MNCPECGAQLEEDSVFCVSCGAKIENGGTEKEGSAPSTDVKEKTAAPTNTSKLIGIIVGIAFIVIGLIRIFTAGTSISSTSFGGDFYTYTYQGIVAVSEILASIEVTLGWIVVAIGAAIEVSAIKR